MNFEILAPAGGEQSAYAALKSGADAVYLGLSRFSARASAENFDVSALSRVARYAHILGAKVYVALNTLVKDDETEGFFSLALQAWNAGADAILLQDIFLGKLLKQAYPQMVLHLSTQAGCCNVYGAELAKEYGFSRIVLARETPIADIERISRIIETEVFVQGALCSCFSGQCYFSSFAGNNSGNRGRCKQPCRKKYSVDRAGYETPAYALSLSDLSVGNRVRALLEAGVNSLKIEGRMRRPEYVASAVAYYRALLGGENADEAFVRLKRAYNRGDYTAGLAFGQDARFLSRKVQGHIGERVGELSVRGGKYFCTSDYHAKEGDGFKLLRGGEEVGGGSFLASDARGFYLRADANARAGDEVRVTTDSASAEAVLSRDRKAEICLDLRFVAGLPPRVCCGALVFEGDSALEYARSAPLTEEELTACFRKTDTLPFSVTFGEVVAEGAFLPKSALNAFRRTFYEKLADCYQPQRALAEREIPKTELKTEEGKLRAAIVSEGVPMSADIVILKPHDYAQIGDMSELKGERYLYLSPFFTSEDEKLIADMLHRFDGIYCEGTYGIALAKRYKKPLFAGTGFNLTNCYAVAGAKAAGAKYVALSKELTDGEQRELAAEGTFALSAGNIKLMDLVYCPFERTCAKCDKRGLYRLTDEGGREFPLRRYRFSGGYCRFEVYNCASLATYNGRTSVLVDCSAESEAQRLVTAATDPNAVKKICTQVTAGHGNRSLL